MILHYHSVVILSQDLTFNQNRNNTLLLENICIFPRIVKLHLVDVKYTIFMLTGKTLCMHLITKHKTQIKDYSAIVLFSLILCEFEMQNNTFYKKYIIITVSVALLYLP